MEKFVKYFDGVSYDHSKGLAAYIVMAQHPQTSDFVGLSRSYDLNIGTLKNYRKILNGNKSGVTPKHISDHLPDLYYLCKNSDVVQPKDIAALREYARNKGEPQAYHQPKVAAPLDFEKPYVAPENQIHKNPAPAEQPKDYEVITERELRSNRLMYFAGVMTGIALLLLFVMIERA